jgi:hypothetical protein
MIRWRRLRISSPRGMIRDAHSVRSFSPSGGALVLREDRRRQQDG